MRLLDAEPRFADVVGVPTFAIQETVMIHLGDGMVRLAGCTLEESGLWVPQYFSVMSYRTAIRCGSRAVLTGQNVMMELRAAEIHH